MESLRQSKKSKIGTLSSLVEQIELKKSKSVWPWTRVFGYM